MLKNKTLAARLLWLFKLLILGVTLSYIYSEVFRSGRYEELYDKLIHIGTFEVCILLFVLLLMASNWSLESRKWQLLMRHISHLSFGTSLKAVFSGVTISTWMPNRIGEYIGRVFYLPPAARVKAIFSTMAGSLCQMFITLAAGTLGLFVAWQVQPEIIWKFVGKNSGPLMATIFGTLLIINIAYLVFLFNLNWVRKLLPQNRRWKKLRQGLAVITYYNRQLILSVLSLAAIRYCVFALQFYLLLVVFKVDVSFAPAIAFIALVFLVQSIVPSIALSELGVRGAASIAILHALSQNTAGIFSASYSLWLINIILPSLFGAIFILNTRYFRKGQKSGQIKEAADSDLYTAPKSAAPAGSN